MSYTTVINQIDTILKSATGVVDANVYKYERLAANEVDYISSFKDTGNDVIHGFIITQTFIRTEAEAPRTNKVYRTFIIRFYYSLGNSGATENTTFQPLIDTIRAKFDEDPTLSDVVLDATPLQIDRIEPLMFGDVLCHYAEMRIETQEEETY